MVAFYAHIVLLRVGCCQCWNENYRRIATLEFDRDRKSMGVIVNSDSGKKSLLVKVFFSYIDKCSLVLF